MTTSDEAALLASDDRARTEDALRRQSEQIAHYRKIANDHGYCGAIVYSFCGDVEGPCACEVGHEGECRP